MQTIITFKKIDTSDSLKSYVQKKLDKFDKILDSPAEAHVVLSVEKIRHIAEISLTCDRLNIHARENSESMYSSVDALMDKVKVQIKKNKEKIRRHMSGNKKSIKDEPTLTDSTQGFSDNLTTDRVIIETIDYKPMDIEDAVIELDSGKQSFFVFNNARTQKVNVLYKQNNGKLGLIQPRG
ncbi:MAG: ribosome-associated translation inhibitor RaiA [Desulfobacula sp.]|jgi:putative sigma-54 modulation protein|uniref:ribosome hibernation-promoting factor, HPF/YfiA family n=1 Tax=Desulfobacula sp. TaxID=2593537 RepID=UPI001D993F4E|nr:ribosome-associated translation inhibitor RaiA [Desulfobacula sp.]MBT3485866.1 ribosome-associated translation inhibitor RaiA [Desulfobacula sp.]MBT3805469.1 ribosome-associated translation inhibitor RaiA [Desulfobacula sp.]MBT4026816.1 ribosome-associated translation inhibitor RaiA [Desulfobacula sp.]MBT4199580.1 ribosome-associated translation inhibitor RaiA [Desulfobacula sp.]